MGSKIEQNPLASEEGNQEIIAKYRKNGRNNDSL